MPPQPTSQLLHHEDGTPLNILVNNAGHMLVICPACKMVWTTQLQPTVFPRTVEGIEGIRAELRDMGFEADMLMSAMNLS